MVAPQKGIAMARYENSTARISVWHTPVDLNLVLKSTPTERFSRKR